MGDQLSLEVDGVVHATSEQFSDRSFSTRRIAILAGDELTGAISRLDGCRTGEAKITPGLRDSSFRLVSVIDQVAFDAGFNLLARYVIHTVGPRYNVRYKTAAENALHSCYRVSVQVRAFRNPVLFSPFNDDQKNIMHFYKI